MCSTYVCVISFISVPQRKITALTLSPPSTCSRLFLFCLHQMHILLSFSMHSVLCILFFHLNRSHVLKKHTKGEIHINAIEAVWSLCAVLSKESVSLQGAPVRSGVLTVSEIVKSVLMVACVMKWTETVSALQDLWEHTVRQVCTLLRQTSASAVLYRRTFCLWMRSIKREIEEDNTKRVCKVKKQC